MNDLSIVIPFRADSDNRIKNLLTVLAFLAPLPCPIIVLEADEKSRLKQIFKKFGKRIAFLFEYDVSPVFHRTRYINKLLQCAKTKYVGVWDSDVIVPEKQIRETCDMIKEKQCIISYPFDGRFIPLDKDLSKTVRKATSIKSLETMLLKPVLGRPSYGGAFIVDKEKYLLAGGENENFIGWGPEDAERVHRCEILGYNIGRIKEGCLYHLYHRPNINPDMQKTTQMRNEFIMECSMTSSELRRHLMTIGLIKK
ncbi:MAG TPA: galactosyltransferase-related protein [Alloprevotella sp.]|nr:galactosyltransferase-related protein [Alloprevotella sp.]